MTTPIEEANISTTIAEYSETEKQLGLLREKLKDAKYEVTTTAGMALACKDRREVITLRTRLEAKRKEIKAPALERCKQIDEEAKRITNELVALEKPIDDQIKAEEARKEEIKRQKEEKERLRIEAIRDRINVIANLHLKLHHLPNSMSMREVMQTVRDQVTTTEAEFQEWLPMAVAALDETLRQMEIVVAEKESAEIEECRKAEEFAKEQRRLAEENERLRLEREAFEKEQEAVRAEAKRIADEWQKEQDAIAAAQKAENDRIAAEQKAAQDAIDAERAAFETERRKVEEEKMAAEMARREEERIEQERLQKEAQAKLEEQRRQDEEKRLALEAKQEEEFKEKVKIPFHALQAIKSMCENKDLSIVALRNQIIAVCDIALSGKD